MKTDDLLLWLTSAGGATAAVSFLLSLWDGFNGLEEKKKFWIRMSLMLVIALGAQFAIANLSVEVKEAISPYVNVLGVVLGGSFIAHKSGKTGEDVKEQIIVGRKQDEINQELPDQG